VANAHLKSVRRRLLYIDAELIICNDGPIITSDTPIERYWLGRKSGENVKVKIKQILPLGGGGDK